MHGAHQPTPHAAEEGTSQLIDAWHAHLTATHPQAAALLQDIARSRLQELVDLFYATLTHDPRAARYLDNGEVKSRLKPSMARWVQSLLTAGPDSAESQVSSNRQIGFIHARVGIPVDLVARGMRVLRQGLHARLIELTGHSEATSAALHALSTAIDLSMEGMSLAYADAQGRASRADATFRLFSMVQNASTERERQRALLLDWENDLLYSLASQRDSLGHHRLSESEFGLWFTHKGIPSFGECVETGRIAGLIERIDASLGYPSVQREDPQSRHSMLHTIRESLTSIRHLLTLLFERMGELDAGSDPLTNLLNRRFLPTVLRREIELASKKGQSFALAVVDLDHFKKINDRYGHECGDRALQHAAGVLTETVRGSDYLFRTGGEEFLVVYVAVNTDQAMALAERMRSRIAARAFQATDQDVITITASIGVALYEGHPDYEHLMTRADAAMYRAKQAGRNCTVLSESHGPATQSAG